MNPTTSDLQALAGVCLAASGAAPDSRAPDGPAPDSLAPRPISIWEITTWILPMAPEHLRRVLAAEPALPQGRAGGGAEGGTRWFTAAEVAVLRGHFARSHSAGSHSAGTARGKRYRPGRPADALAPLIALANPIGGTGRSTALLHLATAAGLAGYRVLVIDADPAGRLAASLGVAALGVAAPGGAALGVTAPGVTAGHSAGVLALIARNAAQHLRRVNQNRLDRGEPPLAMDETLAAALNSQTGDLIRPSLWPGLDVLPSVAGLLQADLQIGAWRATLHGWQPWGALATALDGEDLRRRYDLILADTGRGLGPLALAVLASADVLLAPLPLTPAGLAGLGAGLQGLATAIGTLEAEAQMAARALGQAPLVLPWRRLAVLPTQGGADAGAHLAGFAAKPGGGELGAALLPNPLPQIAQIAAGRITQFYDLDYREIGRLAYTPQRDACEAAWRGVAAMLAGLWAEDSPQHSLALPL